MQTKVYPLIFSSCLWSNAEYAFQRNVVVLIFFLDLLFQTQLAPCRHGDLFSIQSNMAATIHCTSRV